jgi:hypothetical protein
MQMRIKKSLKINERIKNCDIESNKAIAPVQDFLITRKPVRGDNL